MFRENAVVNRRTTVRMTAGTRLINIVFKITPFQKRIWCRFTCMLLFCYPFVTINYFTTSFPQNQILITTIITKFDPAFLSNIHNILLPFRFLPHFMLLENYFITFLIQNGVQKKFCNLLQKLFKSDNHIYFSKKSCFFRKSMVIYKHGEQHKVIHRDMGR